MKIIKKFKISKKLITPAHKKKWSVLLTRPTYLYVFRGAESECKVRLTRTPPKFWVNRQK